jgi:hypothetical protein
LIACTADANDGLKVALGVLWETRRDVPGAFPVMAVHDEIVAECANGFEAVKAVGEKSRRR